MGAYVGGCIGRGLPVAPDDDAIMIGTWRALKGGEHLLLGIKDQTWCSKVLLCGLEADRVAATLGPVLGTTGSVTPGTVERMWDVAWAGTHITSGAGFFLSGCPWFPNGRVLVRIFDAFAQHGWVLADGPTFGGHLSGTVSGVCKVSWPLFVFRRGLARTENLVLGIQDQDVPDKLLAAGPSEVISNLKKSLTAKLQSITSSVTCEPDSNYESTWDAVWQNADVTTRTCSFGIQSSLFPIGTQVLAILEEVSSYGWRLVSAPSFGGDAVEWPVLVFQRCVGPTPKLLLAAVKDHTLVGKLCLSGTDADATAQKLKNAFEQLPGHASVELSKDRFDEDWDAVLRNTKMTTGWRKFALDCFPRNDAVMALLKTTGSLGYSLLACPNFGGVWSSWPCFVFEETGLQTQPAFVAVRDDDYPGKVCVGGAADACEGILSSLRALTGPQVQVEESLSDYDFCLCNTVLTTGRSCMSFQNDLVPYGFMVEVLLGEMASKGWTLVGGPSFGGERSSWPCFVFQRTLSH